MIRLINNTISKYFLLPVLSWNRTGLLKKKTKKMRRTVLTKGMSMKHFKNLKETACFPHIIK